MAGVNDEAAAVSEGLLPMVESTDNPTFAAWAIFAYGTAHRDRGSARRLRTPSVEVSTLAQESGNRQTESNIATMLTMLAVDHGEPTDALNYSTVSIRNHIRLGQFLPRAEILWLPSSRCSTGSGTRTPAATISGFANDPFNRSAYSEFEMATAHLRELLGDDDYESLARTGERMTTAEMVAFAFDHVDRARAALT